MKIFNTIPELQTTLNHWEIKAENCICANKGGGYIGGICLLIRLKTEGGGGGGVFVIRRSLQSMVLVFIHARWRRI
ncbi:MAG: hypothetical protein H0A76_12740 [Candidatus Thiodubiliella endoseptemdiera]|uniref:Uncharacterized protein n=1 Tax=Candidatus Thiodubiliella endoseptemdiera TaxID=2738886 RepID=A0A853F5I4_9GAMM|nr:hypothetical protein [Candidatus Thiodubiliella endoseptemdiera]